MTSTVQEFTDILVEDRLATQITDMFLTYDMLMQPKKNDWEEIRRYVYATDTTHTSNSKLPWKNKTTIPKLCQIMDNLYANYTATMFPQRKWMIWEANERDENEVRKRDAIVNYMSWVITQPTFKHEIDKLILDFIQYGNCFATVEWIDERVQLANSTQTGYVGPGVVRVSPLDMRMNPTAPSFIRAPKIIKSVVSLGEVKDMLEKMSIHENQEEYKELWNYLTEIRSSAQNFEGDWQERNALYQVDGFGSFRDYLQSNMVEVLTFYGDIYDADTDTFLKNHVITVVDRHKLIGKKPNPSFFGYPPIFHVAWRKKQDNLWGMGPLDNLVGMQYRLDHVENMKADIYDLVTYPVQKVKGFVDDYTWQPGEKIYVTDEGDVELVCPDVNALQADFELKALEEKMEMMAGAPREAMGFRSPGEKTKYEVQSLENAAARLFQNKIKQFEEHMIEPLLNAMLELARRNLTSATTIKVFNDELHAQSFQTLTAQDITGSGRLKPVAARHFAERSQMVQNLTSLSGSPIWQTIAPHVSSVRLAKVIEDVLDLYEYNIFTPYVALAEQADAQKQVQALEENVAATTGTASGMGADFDMDPMAAQQMAEQTAPTEETAPQ